MRVFYMAHPYGGDRDNLLRAKRWYAWLCHTFKNVAFDATWIPHCEVMVESNINRLLGIERNSEIATRCDGIVLVGGDLTTAMRMESEMHPRDQRHSLLIMGREPPAWGDTSRVSQRTRIALGGMP